MTTKRIPAFTLITFLAAAAILALYFVATAAGEDKKKTDDTTAEQSTADSQDAQDASAAEEKAAEEKADKKTPIPVRTTAVETGRVAAYISATANLVPENEITILAEWEGRLDELNVGEGDRFAAGQVLATVARDDGEIAFKKAQVRASTSRMAFERAEKLRAEELISSEQFDKVALDHEISGQELAEAEWRLEKTLVRAPWGGVVTQRTVQPGQHVRPGDQLFTVADFDPLVARIYLPEKDVLSLAEGRQVRLSLKADPSVVFGGRIRQISPVVDTATGTVKVTVEATAVPQAVRPGAFVTVDVVREAKPAALLLPREAVVRELQKAYVFVASEGVAERRAVTLGLEEDGKVEITSGVAAGEAVIVAGQGGLKDGATVTVLES